MPAWNYKPEIGVIVMRRWQLTFTVLYTLPGWWEWMRSQLTVDGSRTATYGTTSWQRNAEGRRLQLRDHRAGDSVQGAAVLLRQHWSKKLVYFSWFGLTGVYRCETESLRSLVRFPALISIIMHNFTHAYFNDGFIRAESYFSFHKPSIALTHGNVI